MQVYFDIRLYKTRVMSTRLLVLLCLEKMLQFTIKYSGLNVYSIRIHTGPANQKLVLHPYGASEVNTLEDKRLPILIVRVLNTPKWHIFCRVRSCTDHSSHVASVVWP